MEKNTSSTLHSISSLGKNIGHSVQNFFIDTYNEKKKEISDGLSGFKDGLSEQIDKAGDYINNLTLPVNNFLKDGSQIEKEFEDERKKAPEFCLCLNGEMVPATEVLSRPMEENY